MLVMLSFSKTSRARSWCRPLQLPRGDPSSAHARPARQDVAPPARASTCPSSPSSKPCTRTAPRWARAPPRHRRREPAIHQRTIQPRAPLRRRRAESSPRVDALRAGEHGVEHEHREEIGIGDRGRAISELQVRRGPLARERQPSLAQLLRLLVSRRRDVRRRDATEVTHDAAHRLVGVDIPDDDQRGVVGDVESAVVTE